MTHASLDSAGWYIVAGIMVALIGAVCQKCLGGSDCSTCGMSDLKSEIISLKLQLESEFNQHRQYVRGLCILVRALAERAGMTVKEQAELERLEFPK